MNRENFDDFRKAKLATGHAEVLIRESTPGFENGPHTHAFDTEGVVVRGEFWLRLDGEVIHLKPGDQFKISRGQEHSELYGQAGATYWAARKF